MASVISFSPASASQGQTVTITGTNFTGAAAVTFGAANDGTGGIPAASFIIVNDTTITAVVGAGQTGSVAVFGTQGVGAHIGFTYLGATAASGTVTQSSDGKTLTFTDTSTNITVTSRVLNVYDPNGILLYSVNMGTSLTAPFAITADGYYEFVCTLNGNINISVNFLSTAFYQLAFSPLANKLDCCGGDEKCLNLYKSIIANDNAQNLALRQSGVLAQSAITAANLYLTEADCGC